MLQGHLATALQEVDAAEYEISALKVDAFEYGYTLTFAEPTSLTKDGVTRTGRRAALLTKLPALPILLEHKGDAATAYLRSSGRWVEVMIPIDDGNKHIILASLYNPSGAGFDPIQQE